MENLTIVVLHLALIGAGLSAWIEHGPAYRFFASLFAAAMALVFGVTMLFALLVVAPVVLFTGAKLIHQAAVQKGFPSQSLSIAGAYRYMWSLQ